MSLIAGLSPDLWSLIFENVAKGKGDPHPLQTLRSIALTSKVFQRCVEKDLVWKTFLHSSSIPFAAIDKERLLRHGSSQTSVRLQVKELLLQADRTVKLILPAAEKRTSENYPLQDLSEWCFSGSVSEAILTERYLKLSNTIRLCGEKETVEVLHVTARELAQVFKKQFTLCEKIEEAGAKNLKSESIKNFQQSLQFYLLEYMLPFEHLLSENTKELDEFIDILAADPRVLKLLLIAINPYFFINPLLVAIPEKFKHLPKMCVDLKGVTPTSGNFIAHCTALFKPGAPSLTAAHLAKTPLYLMQKYAFYPNPKLVYEMNKNIFASEVGQGRKSPKYLAYCQMHDPLFAFYQEQYEDIQRSLKKGCKTINPT